MEAMTDYHAVELRMQQAMSPRGTWEASLEFYMRRTLATRHRVKKEFEPVRMIEGGDPPLFRGRVDKATDQLPVLGCSKSIEN